MPFDKQTNKLTLSHTRNTFNLQLSKMEIHSWHLMQWISWAITYFELFFFMTWLVSDKIINVDNMQCKIYLQLQLHLFTTIHNYYYVCLIIEMKWNALQRAPRNILWANNIQWLKIDNSLVESRSIVRSLKRTFYFINHFGIHPSHCTKKKTKSSYAFSPTFIIIIYSLHCLLFS